MDDDVFVRRRMNGPIWLTFPGEKPLSERVDCAVQLLETATNLSISSARRARQNVSYVLGQDIISEIHSSVDLLKYFIA